MAKTDDSRETRVRRERNRLKSIFKNIDPNKKKTIESLIDQAAFIRVSLQDLEEELNVNGWTETYQNGENQCGVKKAAAADVYNSLSKQELAVLKVLVDLTPAAERKESKLAALMGGPQIR